MRRIAGSWRDVSRGLSCRLTASSSTKRWEAVSCQVDAVGPCPFCPSVRVVHILWDVPSIRPRLPTSFLPMSLGIL